MWISDHFFHYDLKKPWNAPSLRFYCRPFMCVAQLPVWLLCLLLFRAVFQLVAGEKNDKKRRRDFCYPIRKERVPVSSKMLHIAFPPLLIIAFHTEVCASNSSLLL